MTPLSFNSPLITFLKIFLATLESTAERGSSSKYKSVSAYTALAKQILAFCPPLKLEPLSPNLFNKNYDDLQI